MPDVLVLSNAPLIEVIAEVHWKLPHGDPAQGYDPQWFSFANKMVAWARSIGYSHIEQLVPAGVTVPLDMLGHAPILRFRPEASRWPLVQLGQGLLTVNAVPPYDGWPVTLAPLLKRAVTAAVEARPELGKDVPVEKLELHYMDAFLTKHGVDDPNAYLGKETGLSPKCPDSWSALSRAGSEPKFSGEFRFELAIPTGASAVAKYGSGLVNSSEAKERSPAAVFDFVVVGQPNKPMTPDEVLHWFGEAHPVSRALFMGALSENSRKAVS